MPKKCPSRERSVGDHPQRRRCYISTVAKLLISQVIAPVLLFTLFLPPLTGFSKIPGIFRKGRLTFGTSVEKLRHDPTPHCCSLQKERGQDEVDWGEGEREKRDTGDGSAVGSEPSLDFGILQRRRASLKPSENVGRYDVGDEGGRMGLRS